MKYDQAMLLMQESKNLPGQSKVNPGLTRAQAWGIIYEGLLRANEDRRDYGKAFFVTTDGTLSQMAEQRVWQVVRNQRKPRF